jgi:hypothetical protein
LGTATDYREAQRLLLPVGAVWTDRDSYDRRMEAFERIQQKLYALDVAYANPDSSAVVPAADLPVQQFAEGLAVRVVQSFRDYDGQEIHAGEILHFIDSSYFFYEGGYTLRFAEKTIRLADIVDEHQPIIANAGNAWFEPTGA